MNLAIVGAGAAGLMAAIWAKRTQPSAKVLLLESTERPGAKILISGGGRCNVTHDFVDEKSFAGSTRPAIRKVLRRFDVPDTVRFFEELGVKLKREETGKLFPVTDRARTVLDALWHTALDAGVMIQHPRRVESIVPRFKISGKWGEYHCDRVILATGGKSVPKTGSDGHGYEIAMTLGHSITRHLDPGLVPLLLPENHSLRSLAGVSVDVSIAVRSSTGKKLVQFDGALLCTHFGLSGPAVLDISRYWIDAQHNDANSRLSVNWIPPKRFEEVERYLLEIDKRTIQSAFRERLPERLIRALCESVEIDPTTPGFRLTRDARKKLASILTEMHVPITGSRGFNYAEVTAGGVPLSELHLDTMESRRCPGLYICGEICDVDGRIGGYNFQWAWASGYVAGISATF